MVGRAAAGRAMTGAGCAYQKLRKWRKVWSFRKGRRSVACVLKLVSSIVSVLARRFRSRAVLELGNLALGHQLHVLRRQRPGRLRLFTIDRLLWVGLYRLSPRCLDTMVLVKPTTTTERARIFRSIRIARILARSCHPGSEESSPSASQWPA